MEGYVATLQNAVKIKFAFTKSSVVATKAALWAIAHVASCTYGAPYVASLDMFRVVVDIAEHCSVLSLRGFEHD
jgi:hypothetical protein